MLVRCAWAKTSLATQHYHDHEWGIPLHDDKKLFEALTLEGAQAGLSWDIILNKREGYRLAFDNFNVKAIAAYENNKIQQLLGNAGIIRNILKIKATIINAKAFICIQNQFASFNNYIWQFALHACPDKSAASMMSKDLKKRGFKFVGNTICYAFMQATGMINGHATTCFRHQEIANLRQQK